MESPHPYTLVLLGRAELRDPDGRIVPLRTRKTLLLLARLSLKPEGFRREELAEAIWPETAARESLRTALSVLRKALPDGALLTEGSRIALAPGFVVAQLEDESGAEFMPGFDDEWTIDQRLHYRSRFVEIALRRARQEGSLEWVERACAADPLSGEAACLRTQLLQAADRAEEAHIYAGAFRARSIRELGIVPDTGLSPLPGAAPNPLLAAVEWTLVHDPEGACTLLAATQDQWTLMSIETSRSIHHRVLSSTHRPTRERMMTEAGFSYFSTISGRPTERAQTAYHAALESGEFPAAARLCEAIAYAALSRGDFAAAVSWAREGVQLAESRTDPAVLAYAEINLAIIEEHATGASLDARVDAAVGRIETHGSPIVLASVQNVLFGAWLDRGEIDRVVRGFEAHRRWIASLGSPRLNVWSLHVEAILRERIGDLEGAYTVFERLRTEASAAGQCAVAIADDGLTRVNCRRGEYDAAALALARVSIYRHRMGTVASRREQANLGPAVQVLKERLSLSDLQTAFRRARRSREATAG